MKKLSVLLILFFVGASIFASTEEWESWLSLGFEYGNFFEFASDKVSDTTAIMNSPGINFSAYSFKENKNIGLFVADSFLFPTTSTLIINGESTVVDLGIYDFLLQSILTMGPAFRYQVSEDTTLRGGVGLSFMYMSGSYSNFSTIGIFLGLGADIGAKYNITEKVFVDFGSKFNLYFSNYLWASTSYESHSGWAEDYFMFSVQPYISFGINLNKEK